MTSSAFVQPILDLISKVSSKISNPRTISSADKWIKRLLLTSAVINTYYVLPISSTISVMGLLALTKTLLEKLSLKLSLTSLSFSLGANKSLVSRLFSMVISVSRIVLSKTFLLGSSLIPSFLRTAFGKKPTQVILSGIIAWVCAKLASKFIWRTRKNAKTYFAMEQSAYVRDIQEFQRPPKFVFTPFLSSFDCIAAPVLIGLENILPYYGWSNKTGPGLCGKTSLWGPTFLDSQFQVIRTKMKDGESKLAEYSDYSVQVQRSIESSFSSIGVARVSTPSSSSLPSHQQWNEIIPRYPSPITVSGQKRSLLFVGNHTCIGADMAPIQWNLMNALNMYMRGIAHRGHFNFPLWSHTIRWIGGVPGTREICAELMTKGWPVLIYPGGGREIMKKIGDDPYELMWGDRYGFTKLAIEHQAIIIPIASAGTAEMFEPWFDIPFDWMYSSHKILKKTIPVESLPVKEAQGATAHSQEAKSTSNTSNTGTSVTETTTSSSPSGRLSTDRLGSAYVSLQGLQDLGVNVPQSYRNDRENGTGSVVIDPHVGTDCGDTDENKNTPQGEVSTRNRQSNPRLHVDTGNTQLFSPMHTSNAKDCFSPYREDTYGQPRFVNQKDYDMKSLTPSNIGPEQAQREKEEEKESLEPIKSSHCENEGVKVPISLSKSRNSLPIEGTINGEVPFRRIPKTNTSISVTTDPISGKTLRTVNVGKKKYSVEYPINDKINADPRVTMPFPKIPFLTSKMERLYVKLGKPIDTAPWLGKHQSETACLQVRDLVKSALEEEIILTRGYQATDPHRYFTDRASTTLKKHKLW